MDIKINNTTGDIEVYKNDVSLIDGYEAVRQHLKIRLQTYFGEWFADASIGVPWFQDILIKNPDYTVVSEILKAAILETEGVNDLVSFSFDISGRAATLNFKVVTDNGVIDFAQEVEI